MPQSEATPRGRHPSMPHLAPFLVLFLMISAKIFKRGEGVRGPLDLGTPLVSCAQNRTFGLVVPPSLSVLPLPCAMQFNAVMDHEDDDNVCTKRTPGMAAVVVPPPPLGSRGNPQKTAAIFVERTVKSKMRRFGVLPSPESQQFERCDIKMGCYKDDHAIGSYV